MDLHAPALCDVEVASALRGLVAANTITNARALEVLQDYADLPMVRHGHLRLLDRVLELRNNFSAYDTTYVALSEALDAWFVTCDAPLARAIRAHIPTQAVQLFEEA